MVRDRSTGVNPLTADEVARQDLDPLFLAWLAARSVEALVDEVVQPAGLTGDELAIYSMLAAGPITPGDLARWMAAPATTVSSYVKRFTSRGHVTRQPNPDDRRSYLIALTPPGRRAHAAAASAFAPVRQQVIDRLGPQDDEVRAALRRLREVADAVREAPAEAVQSPVATRPAQRRR